MADESLLGEAIGSRSGSPAAATRAHAAHNPPLRTRAVGGVAAADDAIFDIAMPLFQTDDVKTGLAAAVDALKAGKPRPVLAFQGD